MQEQNNTLPSQEAESDTKIKNLANKKLKKIAQDINESTTKQSLKKLFKETPSSYTENNTKNNIEKPHTIDVNHSSPEQLKTDTYNHLSKTLQNVSEENNHPQEQPKENQPFSFLALVKKILSKLKSFLPQFILKWFQNTNSSTSSIHSSDTQISSIESPSHSKDNNTTTPKKNNTENHHETIKNSTETTHPIVKAIQKKLDLKTRTALDRMFKGSISPPMKKKYILPNHHTYTHLQAELKLKSEESVHGGSTEHSPTHKGTFILMKLLENKFPHMFKYSAAVNDDFHHDKISYHSIHTEGRAFDYSLSPKKVKSHKEVYAQIISFFQSLGIDTSQFKNEYAKLSRQGTAGHIHMSFSKSDLDQVYKAYAQA